MFEALSINRNTFPGANTVFSSSHCEGLTDFFSFLQTLFKSSTLPVCQRVSVFLSFHFSFFFNRPKLRGSRTCGGGGRAGNGNFCVCMSRFFGSRRIFNLMPRVTNYLSMGTVWFVECASTLSLM